MDTTHSQNGQDQILAGYYEISMSGKRNPGCPLKRLLNCYTENGIGHKSRSLQA
jgi:hypothetical protein